MKTRNEFPNLFIIDHPVVQHDLTYMRDKKAGTRQFRRLLREIAMLMGFELTRGLPMTVKDIETPLAKMQAPVLDGKKLAVVPILRAGLGMADGLLALVPSARVGHLGLYRDHETKKPVEYLVKLPSVEDRVFILVDPMLATGNSAVHAVNVLVRHGVPVEKIRFMALVAAPEGVRTFHEAFPDVPVYVAALDDRLDENAYIVPGLGDAGDRMFGTK
ncbi:MAG: uracil phosphoribosyltransferase [Alphaproteobacteria bacterium]|nr:uracil phosphoribosyltransferase [Alphaproteobacteria bacterium]